MPISRFPAFLNSWRKSGSPRLVVKGVGPLTARQVKKLIVAIDGPAGAGKSTVAKRLAKELDYTYMDTGAMYRALAWRVLHERVDPTDAETLKRILTDTKIEIVGTKDHNKVFLDGLDLTERIRTPEVSQMASRVSALKIVRERMVELQTAMGVHGGVVAEGRDIGTVVFPRADVKIYLDASSSERARRRFEEMRGQGGQVTREATLREMNERDRRDKERSVSPLCKAADAIVIDSTNSDIDGVVDRIMKEIKEKMQAIH